MMRETSNAHNIDGARIALKVFSGDGLTLRGTILSIGQYGTYPNEFTNSSTCRNAKVILRGTACQNTFQTVFGDRVAFELGGITSVGGTGTPIVVHRVGDAATDLPEDDTQLTDGAGWLEFSTELVFAAGLAQRSSLGIGIGI